MTKVEPKTVLPHGRFSLRSMICLVTVCCVALAVASWFPLGLAFIVPPMLGPLVAWSILPTTRSTVWGLASAYFWTIFALLPYGVVAGALERSLPESYEMAFVAGVGSAFGGYLGAVVEKSRLLHLERQRLRKERWGQ